MKNFIPIHNDPNYRDEICLGELELDNLLSEQQIGVSQVPKLGKLKIYVYGKESKDNPHMHLLNESIGFESCLKLYSPEYFTHGSKNGKFNNKQLEVIDKFLRSSHEGSMITKWQFACMTWDGANNCMKFRITNKQPDYTKVNNN